MEPLAFTTPADLKAWFDQNHCMAKELYIRCYKTHAKQKGVTYFQALDEALCFGWIDGVRRRFDDESFVVRFSPRRLKSIWSAVNIKRVGKLETEGRMRPAGLKVVHERVEENSRRYSYEATSPEFDSSYEKEFRANRRAWVFFRAQPPWYQRTSKFWVMSAKQEKTRAKRFHLLIACCEQGTTIPPLTRDSRKT